MAYQTPFSWILLVILVPKRRMPFFSLGSLALRFLISPKVSQGNWSRTFRSWASVYLSSE